MMSYSKYTIGNPKIDEIMQILSTQLTEREKNHLLIAYTHYHKERNIVNFVNSITPLIFTKNRRSLINPIRNVLRERDVPKFNQLLMRQGFITTTKPLNVSFQEQLEARQRSQTLPRNFGSSTPVDGGIKKVSLKRDHLGDLGFSIRGGIEHNTGVYVSWVDNNSAAMKNNIKVGDQILQVNGESFEGISHAKAIQIMRKTQRLRLVLLSGGKYPVASHSLTRYHWVEPNSGRPASPPNENINSKDFIHEPDVKKVRLEVLPMEDLGFSIRGGVEHNLSIFIISVEIGSTAESVGIRPGDVILDVNGVDFTILRHQEAVNVLRTNPVMLMTLKHIGKVPVSLKTESGPIEWRSTEPRRKSPQRRAVTSDYSRGSSYGKTPVQSVGRNATATKFHHGYGTQLMHQTHQPATTKGVIEQRAKALLSSIETNTIMYYLGEYENHGLGIENLVTALLDILDTPRKQYILDDIRQLISPSDIGRYDKLIRKMAFTSQSDPSILEGPHTNIQTRYAEPDTYDSYNDSNFHDELYPLHDDYNQYGNDFKFLDTLPETAIMKSLPNEIADNMAERRKHIGSSDIALDDDDFNGRWSPDMSGRSQLKSEDSLRRAKRQAEDLARRERLVRETEERVRHEAQDSFEAHEQDRVRLRQQEDAEEKRDQEAEDERRERELENIRIYTERRVREELEEEFRLKEEERARSRADERRRKADERDRIREIEEKDYQRRLEEIKMSAESRARKEAQAKLVTEAKELSIKRQREDELYEDELENDKREEERRREIELENVRQEAEDRAHKEVEAEYKKIRDEDNQRKEAEVLARQEAEERRLNQERERIKRQAYEKAKKLATSKIRQEMEERQKRRQSFETRRETDEQKKRNLELRKAEREGQDQALRESKEDARRLIQAERENDPIEIPEIDTLMQTIGDSEISETEDNEIIDLKSIQEAEAKARENAVQKAMQQAEEKRKKYEEHQKRSSYLRNQAEELRLATESVKLDEVKLRQKRTDGFPNGDPSPPLLVPRLSEIEKETIVSKPISSAAPTDAELEKAVELERNKAEKLLQGRMRNYVEVQTARMKETRRRQHQDQMVAFAGYTNLYGELKTIEIRKVAKRLGIAVDGGANTRQKEVKIREIMPGGSAALTGEELRVGQQILQVNGRSLKDLTHKEAVLTIKGAFDANDDIMELVVLQPNDE